MQVRGAQSARVLQVYTRGCVQEEAERVLQGDVIPPLHAYLPPKAGPASDSTLQALQTAQDAFDHAVWAAHCARAEPSLAAHAGSALGLLAELKGTLREIHATHGLSNRTGRS